MDYGALIVGFVVGIVIGAVSMLSLWVTVHWLPNAQRPFVMLAISAGIRILGVLLGFYFLAQSGPLALLGGLVGFVAARSIAISRSRTDTFAPFVSTRLDSR